MKEVPGWKLPPEFRPTPTHQDHGVTRAIFDEWRSPRFGTSNPTNLTNPFWVWQVKTKIKAFWVLREILSEKEMANSWDHPSPKPTWCMDRWDKTLTHLPDGRLVFIGGWDEDKLYNLFAHYNDVVVIEPSGQVTIYGYPEECFPSTHKHTATLVGHEVVIIGNREFSGNRDLKTRFVYVLDVRTFVMRRVETRGAILPAISGHEANLASDGKSIRITGGIIDRGHDLSDVENIEDWSLDLSTWSWTMLTHRNWPRWEFRRDDGRSNHIWNFRHCLREKKMLEDYLRSNPLLAWRLSLKEKLESSLKENLDKVGQPLDLKLIASLYRPSIPHEPVIDDGDEVDLKKIRMDGILVRFTEDSSDGIQMTVEGNLPAFTTQIVIDEILAKLKLLENAEWKVEPIDSVYLQ